ncbi:prepilin peptidase, partial [Escherichia sp. R-CC3]
MDATLPFLILYACLSVLLFLWDAKHGLLPDRFTCPLLWSGLLFSQVCNPDGFAFGMGGLGAAVLGLIADHTSIEL